MTPETFQIFFALLSLGALGVAVAVPVARLAGARALLDQVRPLAVPFAAVITTTAMLGSLYFSEIAGYRPCRLCWWQRAAMYPLAVFLVAAAVRRWTWAWRAAVPVALVGAGISTYHWFLERFPDLDAGSCDPTVPCTVPYFTTFGFVSLAFMAWTAFLATIALVTLRPAPRS